MTVEELRERISNQEYHQWRAFYTYRASLQEQEAAKAAAKAEVKRGR